MFQYGQLKQATQMSRTTLVVLIIVAVLLLQQPDSNLSAAPNSSRFVTLYAHAHPAGEAGNVPILNALSEWALKYYRENLGVTYVFKFKGTPVGFVTLAMASLRKKDLPKERREQKPFRDVPSLLLGHMARDVRFKGQGVGRIMIDWVLLTADRLADEVGCRFVILDAEKDKVELYRSEYSFELIPPDRTDTLSLMYFDLGLRQTEGNGPTSQTSR